MAKELYDELMSLLIVQQSKFPKDLRIFAPSGNNFVYVNNGSVTMHYAIHGMMKHLQAERGKVLDAFAKFEFAIFELLRFAVSGAEVKKPTMEVIKNLSARQRINILFELKIIDNPLKNKLFEIFNLRNGFAHKFSASEVIYRDKPIFEPNNFLEFQKDLQETWNLLAEEYGNAISNLDLKPIINKITTYQQSTSQNDSSSQDKNKQVSVNS